MYVSVIPGKNLKREDLLVSPELQEIIDNTFGNECDYNPGQSQPSDEETTADLIANTKFIQMSSASAPAESSDSSTNDCYYSNNGNAVIFRETTV